MKIDAGDLMPEDEIAERRALLDGIVSCPIAHSVLHQPAASLNREALNCMPIVVSQLMATDCGPADSAASIEANANRWLLPEPWNGHLGRAPLLFIGQNPSADFGEDYPTLGEARCSDQPRDLFEYFESRFDGKWIEDGTRVRLREPVKGSDFAAPNRFLRMVRQIAKDLYGEGRHVTPGIHYALTEAVRCKSRKDVGIEKAIATCAGRYLKDTVARSPARVIVCLGRSARVALLTVYTGTPVGSSTMRLLEKKYAFGQAEPMSTFTGIGDDARQVVFLPHPSAFGESVGIDEPLAAKLRPLLRHP